MDGAAVTRPRAGSAGSARSLLLTVLGEFVLPGGEPVWSGALVTALSYVGVEEKAARQALARTSAEGVLVAERHGRRVRWQLTGAGQQLLRDGAERIYSFGQRPMAWDGRWLVLAVRVPETQRALRHRLRTRLSWLGLGTPMPGLWLTPHTDKQQEVAAVVAELGVEAVSFCGPSGPVGDRQRLVDDAWHLNDVARRYNAFLAEFALDSGEATAVDSAVVGTTTVGARTADATMAVPQLVAAFTSQVALVQQWRHFPFLDPALPTSLLPTSWPGGPAAALFSARHAAWHEPAQACWRELSAAAAARS